MRQPARFFAQLPTQAGYLNPTVYGVACAVISALLSFVTYLVIDLPPVANLFGTTDAAADPDALVLLDTLGTSLLGILLGALVTHVAVRIVVGYENSGLQATYRVMAYSAALFLLDWLPYIGLLFTLYSVYVTVVGIREVHRTTTGKAIGALLLPLLLFVPFLVCIFLELLADS